MIALAVYVLHYIVAFPSFYGNLVPSTDTFFYFVLSRDIALGKFSPPFLCLPGYPLFLSLIARVSHSIAVFILWQHLLFLFAGVLLFKAVSDMHSRPAGLIAGVLYLAYGPFLMHCGVLAPEGLGLFLISLSIFIWSRVWDINSEKISVKTVFLIALVLGILSGLLLVTRPVAFGWLIAIPVYFAIKRLRAGRIKFLLVYFISFILVLLAIAFPNYRATGHWLISAHSGINLYLANNEKSNGLFNGMGVFRPTQSGLIEDSVQVASMDMGRSLSYVEADAYWKEKAVEFIARHPGAFLRLIVRKLWLLFSRKEFYEAQGLVPWPSLPFSFIIPFALLALWTTRKDPKIAVWRLAFSIILLLMLLGFINVRYKLMFAFPSIALAAMGVVDLYRSFKDKKRAVSIYLAVVLAVFSVSFFYVPKAGVNALRAGEYNKAVSLLDKDRPTEALKILARNIKNSPNDWMSWFALGQAYYMLGKYDKSIAAYKSALKINPQFMDAAYNLSVCYLEEKEYNQSLDILKQLSRYSNSPDIMFLMMKSYIGMGDCRRAGALASDILKRLGEGYSEEVHNVLEEGCSGKYLVGQQDKAR